MKKKNAKNKHRNLPEEEKEVKIEYQPNYYDSKKIRKWNINFLYSIKMSKITLKIDSTEVNKKEFHAFKQPIALSLVNVNQIVVSDKFEHSDKGFKYFIGYKDDKVS